MSISQSFLHLQQPTRFLFGGLSDFLKKTHVKKAGGRVFELPFTGIQPAVFLMSGVLKNINLAGLGGKGGGMGYPMGCMGGMGGNNPMIKPVSRDWIGLSQFSEEVPDASDGPRLPLLY